MSDLITIAENDIAKLLAQLERDLNALVKRISIQRIEITTLTDEREQILNSISIEMKRTPGTRWSTHYT